MDREEALLDSGSQIVSMAKTTATTLGITWDPGLTIGMQSAQGHVESTLGLARNVPFDFGGITLLMQVHIISKPAYSILLGRPFDALTESGIQMIKTAVRPLQSPIRGPSNGWYYLPTSGVNHPRNYAES